MLEYVVTFEANAKFALKVAKPTTNYFHPVNYYHVYVNNKKIGKVGMIHPEVKNNLDKKSNIVMAEINFTALVNSTEYEPKFETVSKYQKSTLDFNFIISNEKLYGDIKEIANSIKTPLKYNVSLVDIFDNKDGTKSYTLRYVLYALDHTLSGEEIENFHKSVIGVFEDNNIKLKI